MTGPQHEGIGQGKPPSAPAGAKGLSQALKSGQGASMTTPSARSVPSSPKTGAKYRLFLESKTRNDKVQHLNNKETTFLSILT